MTCRPRGGASCLARVAFTVSTTLVDPSTTAVDVYLFDTTKRRALMRVPSPHRRARVFYLLVVLAGCLVLGEAGAGDQGPRHHAEGQYDAATATYRAMAFT